MIRKCEFYSADLDSTHMRIRNPESSDITKREIFIFNYDSKPDFVDRIQTKVFKIGSCTKSYITYQANLFFLYRIHPLPFDVPKYIPLWDPRFVPSLGYYCCTEHNHYVVIFKEQAYA